MLGVIEVEVGEGGGGLGGEIKSMTPRLPQSDRPWILNFALESSTFLFKKELETAQSSTM